MNSSADKLLSFRKRVFWSTTILVAALIVALSVILSIRFEREKEWQEPSVTLKPENNYTRTLHVIGDLDYKPFSYFRDSNEPQGYDIELVTELANRLGYNLDLELMNWNEATDQMEEKKADLILGCDWQDIAVLNCEFSIPTFDERFVAFVKETGMTFNSLYKEKIALIEGCGLKETLTRYQLWPNCIEYPSVTDCVNAVLDGECTCFISHAVVGEACLRSFGDAATQIRGRIDVETGQMCFGIIADHPELFAAVNNTLLTMRTEGFMERLAEKWIMRSEEEITLERYMRHHPFVFFFSVDLLVIVLLIFLVMNYYLIQIRKERNRAIAAERAKTSFFSMVSHDIRTPLNSIIGFSELLKTGIKDGEEQQNALEAIQTSGQMLLDLVNDVLDLSKLDAGKVLLKPEMTDLRTLASEVLRSFEIAISGGDVKLEKKIDPIPLLFIDPQRIRQILFNLIGNAVKFTEHGSIVLAVSFERRTTDGQLVISVSDTGCGIAPEDLENILKPFVQAAEMTGQSHGTGLGLTICCRLAERLGGKLTVTSTLGRGSTFTVTVPNVPFSDIPVSEKADEKRRPDRSGTGSKPGESGWHVLVADDVLLNVKVIKSMLRRLGVSDVITAGNGVEALETLQKNPTVNLVLTDMWMPVMDGEGLIREIRSREQWKDLPVYAVTADIETQKTYRNSGFTGILLKPITLERLHAIID